MPPARSKEEDRKAQSNGIEPVEFVVARDAIAVIVHPENPVNALTLEQISDIYSGLITTGAKSAVKTGRLCAFHARPTPARMFIFSKWCCAWGERQQNLFAQNTLLLPSSEGIISRSAPEPQCHWLRRPGIRAARPESAGDRRCEGGVYVVPRLKRSIPEPTRLPATLYIYTAGQPKAWSKNTWTGFSQKKPRPSFQTWALCRLALTTLS
jgi:phosphate transport system substrate-binding protein